MTPKINVKGYNELQQQAANSKILEAAYTYLQGQVPMVGGHIADDWDLSFDLTFDLTFGSEAAGLLKTSKRVTR